MAELLYAGGITILAVLVVTLSAVIIFGMLYLIVEAVKAK